MYPKIQHSIREIKTSIQLESLELPDLDKFINFTHNAAKGGIVKRLINTRIGQQEFRRSLLKKYGSNCIFSGKCPEKALDAAHLYSYSTIKEHRENGGLLMRSDYHRLFDNGLIGINPENHKIWISKKLKNYPEYTAKNNSAISHKLSKEESCWLAQHWEDYK